MTLPPPPPLRPPPKRVPLLDRVFGSFSNAPRSALLLWNASPWGAIAMAAFGLLQAAFPVAMAWVAKLIIDGIVGAVGTPAGLARDAAIARITLLIALEFGLVAAQMLVSQGVRLVQTFCSHRFASVRSADRILVLDEGRLIEAGTHAELVAAGGRYASLFALQAAGYR